MEPAATKRPSSVTFLVGLVLLVMAVGLIIVFIPLFACPLPRHGLIVCGTSCPRCGDNSITLWNKWFWMPRTPDEEAELLWVRSFSKSPLGGRAVVDQAAEGPYRNIQEAIEKSEVLRIRFQSEQSFLKAGKRSRINSEGTICMKGYGRVHASVRIWEREPDPRSVSEGLLIADGSQFSFDFPRLRFRDRSRGNDFCASHLKSSLMLVGASLSLDLAVSPDSPSSIGDGSLLSMWSFQVSELRRGSPGVRGQTLTFLVGCDSCAFPFNGGRICRGTLEYDPIRWLPLCLTLVEEDSGYECREIYEEFTLNADIPDEKFKLPEEKK